MKWEDFRSSDNLQDYRGGGGGGMVGGGGLGIGAILILGIIGYLTGIDPRILISGAEMVSGGSSRSQPAPQAGPPTDEIGRFVSAVLAQTEDVWKEVLPAQKRVSYVQPKLVLFSGATRSACGAAQSAMGPFYCPLDQKVYLDTSFFEDMRRKLGGGGDFAYAYVIAHEIGHHVENVLGILPKVQEAQQRSSQQQANALSVRVELMADCLAGVWAHHAEKKWKILQDGDLQEALSTAAAIGDDRLQKAGRGYAVPDSFTHGSSAQRTQWLKIGLQSGQVDACNTFSR
ncbi:MAG: neutral zinc metallopeptidase [Methylobacteriaceae bacterium]|nr:neutral zinc metallopeptidase [Methylobacteriaceae bacterium]